MAEIEWGNLQPAPNFSAGVAQSFEAGRQMGLQKQADNALARARANPDDPQAMTDLALYNPQAANAFMAVKANQRAIQARSAASDVFKSYGNITAPPPVASPAAGSIPPQATTVPNVPQMLGTLPGPNGQPGQPMPQGAAGPSPIGPQTLPNGDMQPGTVSPTAMLQPDHPITQAIGGAVANGQMSLPDAIAKFAQFADPQETAQMIQSLGQMDKLRRDRLGESADALASEAVTLKNVPQAQRMQVAMAALPQLAAHGVTPEMIQGADLSDNGLNGIIGQSIGAKALIDEANKQTELGFEGQRLDIARDQNKLGYAQLDETKRRDTLEYNKPISVPFGQSLVNPQTNQVVYDGFGGGSGGGDPYNVVVGNGQYGKPPQPLTSMTVGQVYDFGRSTLIPNTKAAGVGKDSRGTLGSSAVGAYQITGETLAKIAPQVLGADWRNQAFTPEVQDKLGAAIYADAQAKGTPLNKVWASLSANEAQALKGQPWEAVRGKIIAGESGGSGQSSGMGMLQATAEKIANYDMPPPSGRAAMTPQAMMTMQIVKTMNPTYDATQYPMRAKAALAFGTGKQGDAVRSFNVAVDNLDKLQGAAKALGNGNIQLFNSISNAFRTAGGSAIPTNFEAIKNFVMDETTKAIVGTSGGVADREKAAAIINSAQSPEQLAGAIYQVKALMVGQLKGLQQQYETSTGRSDFANKLSFETRYISRIGRPPDEAVALLKQNPGMASAFDQKFGRGASKWYLRK